MARAGSKSDDSVPGVGELHPVPARRSEAADPGSGGVSVRMDSIRGRRCLPGVGRFGEVGIGQIPLRTCAAASRSLRAGSARVFFDPRPALRDPDRIRCACEDGV
jgi:hypothetical protein